MNDHPMRIKTMLIPSLFLGLSIASPIQGAPSSTTPLPTPHIEPVAVSGYPSLEVLVEAAVTALNANDTNSLTRMAFGREDFLRAYPLFESDTSSSRRDFACNFYLEDNRKVLTRIIQQSGGNALEVIRIEAHDLTQDSAKPGHSFELSRGIKIWVRQGKREIQLRLIKSASRTKSGWKIWGFADD
jgi:hypothetical protein